MIEKALEGLRVVDLTHYIAGPVCTKLLADFGAEVVKIERPGSGDGARRLGPFPGDAPDPEKSALFLSLNTDKRSATLNLKTPRGIELVKEMVRKADVLVENFKPRVMPSLGLDYETLSEINPRLVMVSISDFGQTGPYRDWQGSEIVDYALGGPMQVTGQPDRNPLKLGHNVIQYLAGAHGAAAVAVASVGADFTGQGDHVDISIMETQAGTPDRRTILLMGYQFTGSVNRRGTIASPVIRPCGDGYINIGLASSNLDRLSAMLEMPELKSDPRFSDLAEFNKPENVEALDAIYLGWLMDRTMADAWSSAQKARAYSAPIYSMADVLADDCLRDRGFWESIEHPSAGRLDYPGRPFKSPGGDAAPRQAAPRLGEHTREILAELGVDDREFDELARQGVV